MNTDLRRVGIGAVATLILSATIALFATNAAAADTPVTPFQQACQAFKPKPADATEGLLSVEYQPATGRRPAFCLVRASITTSERSQIRYRVDLPESASWNGKLLTIGGGGEDGYISLDGVGFDLWSTTIGYQSSGLGPYVLVSTDSGHQGRGVIPAYDMSWAAENSDAMTNHAFRANHLVLLAAVRTAKQFYGREPSRRYMAGGSNGGRQGLMAAQHYPDDYQGILSLEPALSQAAIYATMIPVFQHIYKDPGNWLGADALDLYTKAEVEACDGLDGLKDGVINDYDACRFDPATLVCPPGAAVDPKVCLTPGQVETVRLVRSDKDSLVAFANGLAGYPGYGPGSTPSAWVAFLTGSSFEKRDAGMYLMCNQWVKVITDDPNADVMSFDVAKWRKSISEFSGLMDTTNPDLSAFFARGGKIIIWQGGADTAVSAARTAQYVAMVDKALGAATVRKSLRSYVSPAIDHYFAGPGAGSIPLLELLENWVEKDRAPGAVIATRFDPPPGYPDYAFTDKIAYTRPLCEDGGFPRYKGHGDSTKASSFECALN